MSKFKELDGYIEKIDKGIDLTERELDNFQSYSIEDIDGEQHRWTQDVESIVQDGDRLFSLTWSQGLTESCESFYCNQPIEVKKVETKKTITVVDYVPINEVVKDAIV